MSVALITQPSFLHAHFSYTRQGLLGQWPKRAVQASSEKQLLELPNILNIQATEAVGTPQVTLPEIETVPGVPLLLPTLDTVPAYLQRRILQSPSPKRDTASTVKPSSKSLVKSIFHFMLSVVIVLSVGVSAVIVLPEIYYSVFSQTDAVNEVVSAAKTDSQSLPVTTPEPEPYMPPQNPDLPTGTWISIPRIGVYTEMRDTLNADEALNQGVWLVPDFGRPGDTTQPVIAAAHRYGWDWWWKSDYWKYNSFYLLPETEPGDRIEVIYDQRRWVYEIYAGEEGELITDYDADLILYTCKYLNSPVRHFRYARVVEE